VASVTVRSSIANGTDLNSYSFTAFTPGAGSALCVGVRMAGTNPVATISDDQGLTWSERFANDGSTASIHCWTAMAPASPSSTTVTVSFTGATGCCGEIFEIVGGSFRQVKSDNGLGAATPAVAMDAAFLTTSVGIAYLFTATNPPTVTEPSSWTEQNDTGHALPNAGMETAYRNSGETNTTITWGSTASGAWRVIVVEFAGTYSGTGAISLNPVTVAGVGKLKFVGTSAISLNPVTVSGVGSLKFIGSGTPSLSAITVSGAGKQTFAGTGAISLPSTTVSGTGVLKFVATSAITLPAVTVSGAGSIALTGFAGTGAVSLSAITVVGVGTMTPAVASVWTSVTASTDTWTSATLDSSIWTDVTPSTDTWTDS
jgi:hypothetical protein